jgi:hypothetical protein
MEMLGKMSASVQIKLLRKKYRKEIAGICIAGGVVTFLIMIAISGLLYGI